MIRAQAYIVYLLDHVYQCNAIPIQDVFLYLRSSFVIGITIPNLVFNANTLNVAKKILWVLSLHTQMMSIRKKQF